MKYLKLFETQAQYESWKNGSDYVLPNVVFNEETGVIYNPYIAPASPNIVVTYNVTDSDINYHTNIPVCGNYAGNNISTMIVDGIEMDFEYIYPFETAGVHTIEFVLIDPTKLPNGMFYDTRMSFVEKIELPATLTDGSFSIRCNDSAVKEIVFNSKTAPSSINWYKANEDTHADCVIKYPKGSDYSSVINSLPNRYAAVEF